MKRDDIIILLLICLLIIGVYMAFFNINKDCLEKISTEYCQGKDLTYTGVSIYPMFFFCHEYNDVHDVKRFTFTNEERSSCERIKLFGEKDE